MGTWSDGEGGHTSLGGFGSTLRRGSGCARTARHGVDSFSGVWRQPRYAGVLCLARNARPTVSGGADIPGARAQSSARPANICPGAQPGIGQQRAEHDGAGALFRRGIPRLAQPYRSWAGDRPWMKYKDYKEMSAIKRLKFAEQRQSGVMKAILRAPKGAPNFGSLFPEGESDE